MSEPVAIVVFVEHQQPADRGRMAHVLNLAAELQAAGTEFELVFAGKSVEWLPQWTNPNRAEEHPFIQHYGNLFDQVRDHVVSCNFCNRRFETTDAVQEAGIPIHGDGSAHLSMGRYLREGWRIVTF